MWPPLSAVMDMAKAVGDAAATFDQIVTGETVGRKQIAFVEIDVLTVFDRILVRCYGNREPGLSP